MEVPNRFCWAVVVLACFLAAHFGWLAAHHVTMNVGPDAHDYFLTGRLMAEHGTTGVPNQSPLQFLGQQWFPQHDALYHSVHDVGFPLLLAAVETLLGGSWVSWVNPVLVSLTLVGFFLWSRRRVGAWPAVGAVVMLAFLPALNQSAAYGDSHPLTSCCMVWALFFGDGDEDGRRSWWALVAGLLLGVMPVIRAADVLVAAGLGGVLLLRALLGRGRSWRFALLLVTGAVMPLAGLMAHNASCYGAPWKTAYSGFGGQSIFALKYVGRNAEGMRHLFATGSQACLMWGGPAAFFYMLVRRAQLWTLALIAAGTLGNLAIYLPFYWPVEEVNDRFFIPACLLMAASLALAVQSVARSGRGMRTAVTGLAGIAALGSMGVGAVQSWQRMDKFSRRDEVLREAMTLLHEKTPKDAVVVSDFAIAQEIDAEGGWRAVDLGRVMPPQLRGLQPRTTGEAKPISRRNMGQDEWLSSMIRTSPEEFSERALAELKPLVHGKYVYVLALTHERESLSQRWPGNWTMLGSFSLPVETPDAAASPGYSEVAGPRPVSQGKLYDLRLDGQSVDLMQAKLW